MPRQARHDSAWSLVGQALRLPPLEKWQTIRLRQGYGGQVRRPDKVFWSEILRFAQDGTLARLFTKRATKPTTARYPETTRRIAPYKTVVNNPRRCVSLSAEEAFGFFEEGFELGVGIFVGQGGELVEFFALGAREAGGGRGPHG